eukprot:403356151
METNLNSYSQIDLSSIQRSKINSERELEIEVQKIVEILKDSCKIFSKCNDIETHDWKKRAESLKKVQEITMLFEEISSQSSNISFQHFMSQILKLQNPLTAQALDLRSASAREAGKTIQIMAQVMQNDFEPFVNKFISKDSLIKLLHNGTKVLAEVGNQTITALIYNTVAPKIIQKFQEELKVSKNPWAHSRMTYYLYLIVKIYPFENCLAKYYNYIELMIQQSLSDSNSEARQFGRKAFLHWQKYCPQEAEKIFMMLDYAVQKAILEEREDLNEMTTTKSLSKTSIDFSKVVQKEKSNTRPLTAAQPSNHHNQQKTKMARTPVKSLSRKSEHSPINQGRSENKSRTVKSSNQVMSSTQNQVQQQRNQYINPFGDNFTETTQTYQEPKSDVLMKNQVQLMKVSFDQIYINLKSTLWNKKVEALENLMTYLIDLEASQLQKIIKKEKTFPLIVQQTLQVLQQETNLKVLDVSMDFVQFLLTQLPENLFSVLESLTKSIFKLMQNKNQQMFTKANELFTLTIEVLSSNVILPYLIGELEELSQDSQQLSQKISGLEMLVILLKSAELDEEIQFESTIGVIGQILSQYSTQRSIQNPSLGAILQLRDSNQEATLKCIQNLPSLQFNIIKQLANAYDRNLAKQISQYQETQRQQEQQTHSCNQVASQIIQIYQIIGDCTQTQDNKLKALRNLNHLQKQQASSQFQDAWKATFESLLDSILALVQNPTESFQLKDIALRTLSEVLKSQSRDRFLQYSMKVQNMQMRDKILEFCLNVYTSTINPQNQQPSQNLTNCSIDEIIDCILLKSDIKYLSEVLAPLMNQVQPPKVQAIIRAISNRVKAINQGTIEYEFKTENYVQIVKSLVSISGIFAEVINNQNADVRKCSVFCIVEIHSKIGDENFMSYLQKLNPSQQKLIDIYIKRKQEMIKHESQQKNENHANVFQQYTN